MHSYWFSLSCGQIRNEAATKQLISWRNLHIHHLQRVLVIPWNDPPLHTTTPRRPVTCSCQVGWPYRPFRFERWHISYHQAPWYSWAQLNSVLLSWSASKVLNIRSFWNASPLRYIDKSKGRTNKLNIVIVNTTSLKSHLFSKGNGLQLIHERYFESLVS